MLLCSAALCTCAATRTSHRASLVPPQCNPAPPPTHTHIHIHTHNAFCNNNMPYPSVRVPTPASTPSPRGPCSPLGKLFRISDTSSLGTPPSHCA